MKENTSVYQKLKLDLKKAIINKKFLSGDCLPSENSLARKYNISRPSVRKALFELEKEALIFKKPGKGTFVRDRITEFIKPKTAPENLIIGVNFNFNKYIGANWYYNQLMGSIIRTSFNLGCTMQLISNLNGITRNRIDGIIWGLPAREEFKIIHNISRADIPIIIVNRTPDNNNLNYITTDHRDAVFRGIEYLFNLNHRKICFIGSSFTESPNRERLEGYVDAFAKNSVEIDNNLIFEVEPAIKEQTYQQIFEIISKNNFSALFLAGGAFAASALKAIYDKGLKVPDDISIVCFDDIEGIEEHPGPPLTSIRQPLSEMGKRTVHGLISLVQNRHAKITEVIPSEFVMRESCKVHTNQPKTDKVVEGQERR
ncbi:MAG: GntR family transcriptional regulator [bacterium]